MYQKAGTPFLYDDTTGDILGVKDPDGSEHLFFMSNGGPVIARSLIGARTFGMALSQLNGTTFAGYTWQVALSVPGGFNAVRLNFANTTTNAITIDGAAVGSSSSESSLNNVSGSGASGLAAPWVPVTFSGSAGGTVPANTNSSPSSNPVYYKSDWIGLENSVRTDGGTRAILLARCYIVNGSGNLIPASGTGVAPNFAEATAGFLYKTAFQTGNFLSSSFTAATNPGCCPIIGFEFAASTVGLRVAHFGDSIDRGYAATMDGNGWGQRMAVALNAASPVPIWYESYGWDAQTPLQYYTRWSQYLTTCLASGGNKPQVAIFKGWSTNGAAPSNTTTATDKALLTRFVADCHANGIFPVLVTGQPRNSLTASEDATRVNCNTFIRSLASPSIGVIDIDAALSAGGSPAQYVTGYANADGVHPSDAGYAAAGVRAASDLRSILGI